MDTDQGAAAGGPRGIGGWLWLPLLNLAIWLVIGWPLTIGLALRFNETIFADDGMLVRFLISLVELAYITYCLVRFLQKRRQTRMLMIVLYAFGLVYLAAQVTWPLLSPQPPGPLQIIVTSALCAAGLAYFIRSKRVRSTFVQ